MLSPMRGGPGSPWEVVGRASLAAPNNMQGAILADERESGRAAKLSDSATVSNGFHGLSGRECAGQAGGENIVAATRVDSKCNPPDVALRVEAASSHQQDVSS